VAMVPEESFIIPIQGSCAVLESENWSSRLGEMADSTFEYKDSNRAKAIVITRASSRYKETRYSAVVRGQ
jgi:hypothetical protein